MLNNNLVYNKYRSYFDSSGLPRWNDGDVKVYLVFGECGWAIDRVSPPYDDEEVFYASEFHDHIDDYVADAIIQKWINEK